MKTPTPMSNLRVAIYLVLAIISGLVAGPLLISGPPLIIQSLSPDAAGLAGAIGFQYGVYLTTGLVAAIVVFLLLVRATAGEQKVRKWIIVTFITSIILCLAGLEIAQQQSTKSSARLLSSRVADYGRIQGTWHTDHNNERYQFVFSSDNYHGKDLQTLSDRQNLLINNITTGVTEKCSYEIRIMHRINNKDVPFGFLIECSNWQGQPLLSANKPKEWLQKHYYKQIVIQDEAITLIPDEIESPDTSALVLQK